MTAIVPALQPKTEEQVPASSRTVGVGTGSTRYMAPEVLPEDLLEDLVDIGQSKHEKIKDFDENKRYIVFPYWAPMDTVFGMKVQMERDENNISLALTVMQCIEPREGQQTKFLSLAPRQSQGLLESIALVRQETEWVRLVNPPRRILDRMGIDQKRKETVYVKLLPAGINRERRQAYPETRVLILNISNRRTGEFTLSDLTSSDPFEMYLTPLSAKDKRFLKHFSVPDSFGLVVEQLAPPSAITEPVQIVQPMTLTPRQDSAQISQRELSPVVALEDHRDRRA